MSPGLLGDARTGRTRVLGDLRGQRVSSAVSQPAGRWLALVERPQRGQDWGAQVGLTGQRPSRASRQCGRHGETRGEHGGTADRRGAGGESEPRAGGRAGEWQQLARGQAAPSQASKAEREQARPGSTSPARQEVSEPARRVCTCAGAWLPCPHKVGRTQSTGERPAVPSHTQAAPPGARARESGRRAWHSTPT